MKKGIHPKYYTAKIVDTSSGTVFELGSTLESYNVEISSYTHPFYTGKQRIVDTDNLVEKFERKLKQVDKASMETRKKKKIARRTSSVTKIEQKSTPTLKDMLAAIK